MGIKVDDETLQIYLDESKEHLKGIESDLLAIEEAGEQVDDELVNKVFRAIHSVKGGAGFFAFSKIKDLAHAMENLLGLIRKRELAVTSELVSLLLENADTLNALLNNIGALDEMDISEPLAVLKNALAGNLSKEKKQSIDKLLEVKLPDGRTVFNVTEFEIDAAKKAENGGKNVFLLTFDLIEDIERKGRSPYEIVSELLQLTVVVDSKLDLEAVGTLETFSEKVVIPFYILVATKMESGLIEDFLQLDPSRIHRISTESGAEPTKEAPKGKSSRPESPALVKAEAGPSPDKDQKGQDKPREAAASPSSVKSSAGTIAESSIRVNVKVIDHLMSLAGELVLSRNQLIQNVAAGNFNLIEKVSQRLNIVTTEVQDAIMSTRMQSIGIVFGKFHRIVRDLARSLDKKISLVLEGEDVELDKTIIEAIGDPMTHLIRNAVDHGFETPEARREAGKPETGTLRLTAAHKAGQVIIEIADDGAGIDPVRIRNKALSMGLYSAAQLDEMTEQALVRLVFHPGFSTAAEVTDVSGRGVGMDVVLSNLSKLGGVVDLDSVKGQGTIVRITLPLTLAIIPSLLVSEEGEQFAIPQINLVELVRIAAGDVKNKIEMIGDAAVMRLRGELLPLVRLRDVLGMKTAAYRCPELKRRLPDRRKKIVDRRSVPWNQPARKEQPAPEDDSRSGKDRREAADSAVNVAVVATGDFHYGLIVESLLDSAEIVVKPLGNHLRDCRTYAGATILGDGRVALILDVVGIGQKVRLTTMESLKKEQQARQNEVQWQESTQALLLVANAPGEQYAVPLGLVERIEKIDKSKIETVGGRRAMQSRGGSLPLMALEDIFDIPCGEDIHTYYVIVFKIENKEAGLMVSRIRDITDVVMEVDEFTHRQPGIFGSLIINGTTTLLLDLNRLAIECLAGVNLDQVSETDVMIGKEESRSDTLHTVLVVEDSKFFLNQIRSFVEEAGYQSLSAVDGLDALNVLEANENQVDLVLTDIEMPNLDGFGLTERIRSDPRFKNLPVLAVTSVMGAEAEEKGRSVGIDEYMIKLNREHILERCRHFLAQGRGEVVG